MEGTFPIYEGRIEPGSQGLWRVAEVWALC